MRKVILSGKSAMTIAICFLMLQCVSVHSSGDDNASEISDPKDLTGFNSIGFNIPGTLYLEQDSAFSVSFEGKEEDLEKIITKIEGDILIIKTKPGSFSMGDVTVYVSMPVVKGLNVSGSGNIVAENLIKSTEIQLNVSGSGNIKLNDLNSTEVVSSISGSGGVDLKGAENESLTINIAGSGDFISDELSSKNVVVSIAGSGSAKVFASEKLKTDIAGSGDVYYKGEPLVNANSVGSGSTKSIN